MKKRELLAKLVRYTSKKGKVYYKGKMGDGVSLMMYEKKKCRHQQVQQWELFLVRE